MARVSKKHLDERLKTEAWNRFLGAVQKSDSAADLVVKLRAFLTPTEIAMLEKRLCIPLLVEQKQSYRAIGRTIDVSPVTISFVKHNLTKGPVVHRRYSSNRKPKKKYLKYPVQAWVRNKIDGND